ncbi:tetratricopeptide repeat protein [Fundidesulfovibrio butyratiphilus]
MSGLITRAHRESIDDKTIIIFDHIIKCAGSSLFTWLCDELSSAPLCSYSRDGFLKLSSYTTSDGRLVCGHEAYGAHSILPDEFRSAYVTMIRNPLKRVVSNYVYYVEKCLVEPYEDIDSFILNIQPNYLVRWLGNGDFKKAKERLLETYCCFGIAEYFETSLDHIANVLQTNNTSPVYEINKASYKTYGEMKKKTLEYFMDANAQDFLLYEVATKEFFSRLDQNERTGGGNRQKKVVKHHELYSYVDCDIDNNVYKKYSKVLAIKAADDFEGSAYSLQSLAQRLGGLEEALELLKKLHSIAPFRNVHTYVDLLLRMGRLDEAVVLAEENWAVFSSHAMLPSDSRMYGFYFENLCLLIKAYSGVDTDKMKGFVRQAAVEYRGEKHLLEMLLCCLNDVGAHEDVVDICKSYADDIDVNNVRIYYMLALAYFRMNNVAQAKLLFEKILSQTPLYLPAISMLIVSERLSREFALDIEKFEILVESYQGSCFGAALAREIAVYHYEKGQKERALELCEKSAMHYKDSLIEELYRANDSLSFDQLSLGKCLVIKSGPDMVFDSLYRKCLSTSQERFDLVSNFDSGRASDYTLVDNPIAFPSSRYIHTRDFSALRETIEIAAYDSCIVLASALDLSDYAEILKLALATGAETVCFYSMDHMFSAKYRSSFLALRVPPA